ncbi:MAG: HlyD family efflux transporter periplasmic adaptor subunit [Bryobacteraceae bacterium]
MSAILHTSAAPEPAPERPGPRPAAIPPRSPQHWRWISAAVVVAILALAAYLLRPRARESTAAPLVVRTAKVTKGSLGVTLRVAGATAAGRFVNIVAPMMRGPDSGRSLILMKLVNAGSVVNKGEVIAEIDAQSSKDHVDDITALVVQAEADVRKRRAEQAIEMENLRQNARIAKAAVEKAKLDAGAAEIRSEIDREQLKLAVEEAEATYRELQKEVTQTEELQRAEIRILELTRDRHAHHRDRHAVDVTRFTVHAPIGGLAVMESIWRGGDMGQVQKGDEVDPGEPFMKIVDTSSMQIEGVINQAESELVRIGQPAEIGLDAFPGIRLKGRVYSVGALAVGGWRQNYYIRNIPVKVRLDSQDPRVIPDLSAFADVQLSQKPDSLVVPAEAVRSEGEEPVVYVKRGTQFVRREVKVGERNNTQVSIVDGLAAGDEVALQPVL